jgi:hypothetical protein
VTPGDAEHSLAVNALRLRADFHMITKRRIARQVGGLPSSRFLVPFLLREAAHPDLLVSSTEQITTSLNHL